MMHIRVGVMAAIAVIDRPVNDGRGVNFKNNLEKRTA
jgi:hypothetical protein